MSNPLYRQLAPQPTQSNPMLQRLINFKNNISGNPQQIVQNILNSGKIPQSQINQYVQQANEIYKNLKGLL